MGAAHIRNKKKVLQKPIPKSATKDLGAHEVKKITVNCDDPVKDRIFEVSAFKTFLQEKIKVDGRTGNLGDQITVSAKGNTIEIVAKDKVEIPSSRYIKYLTKKHLKKLQLRDWIRVTSTSQCNYRLKFFNVQAEEEAEEDDE